MAESTSPSSPVDPKAAENEKVDDEQPPLYEPEEKPIPVKIVLPGGEEPLELHLLPSEQIHEIRQSIIEQPPAVRYSCFHLEHNGVPINDFVQVSDVAGIAAGSELHLVEDPYTEKEARIHLIRIRDLIGAAGDRTDTIHGVLAGLSIHDGLVDESADLSERTTKEDQEKPLVPVEEYDFGAPSSVSTLLPRKTEVPPKTVEILALSPWNPPPAHWRQRGHLLYLTVRILDGISGNMDFHITAHVGGFYVNNCTTRDFDPSPKTAPTEQSAHSLFSLLEKISPRFKVAYQELVEFQSRRDPLSTFQMGNAFPSAPWIVPLSESPLNKHVPDIARPQEPYLLSGVENTDSLRDWNEEFQSARELPKDSLHDKVFRERLLCKLYADYNDAAARGAVLVARGEVAPLNPTEAKDAQIFVYNNIFYSFGADGVGTFTTEGGHEAARVATGKDVHGVKLVNQLDIDGLYTPGTVVVDYLGKRIVGQSIVPGIFKQPEPGENHIHYGALDGKDVVASDPRFVPVFKKLARSLHVKPHPVWDKEGKRFDLEASVEMKGLLGTDGRKYVLDLYRITPLDKLWMKEDRDEEDGKYPHRMTVLRPELVVSFGKFKAQQYKSAQQDKSAQLKNGDMPKNKGETNGEEKKEEKGESEKVKPEESKEEKAEEKKAEEKKAEVDGAQTVDMSGFTFALNPDAFSDQKPQTVEERAALDKDEKDVLEACNHLRSVVIPTLLNELKEADISFPMDGRSLTRQLHKRGINMRYLGKLATESNTDRLRCFHNVCVREMIARSFKHVAAKYLKELPLPLTSACFAHLLNCLLGCSLNPKPEAKVDESLKEIFKAVDLTFTGVTPESLRADIALETTRRFRYRLADRWWVQIGPLQMLREISLKLGLQLQAKDYAFTAEEHAAKQQSVAPEVKAAAATKSKGKKKNKKTGQDEPIDSVPHTFSPDDFVNVVPIVKDACPRSNLPDDAMTAGRITLGERRDVGEDLLLESLSLCEQIYGLIHPEVAQMYHALSQLYYQMEQKEAAVELAKKAVIVSERTVGLDASETVLNYLNLSLFLHQTGKTKEALMYARHAMDLWKVIYGRDHPDTITTMNNYAVMLQSVRQFHESRRWFEEALRICESLFGEDTVHTATLLFQLAQALALDKSNNEAVKTMKRSRDIFKKTLGADDKNTEEANYWLAQLTTNAVNLARRDTHFRRHQWPLEVIGAKEKKKEIDELTKNIDLVSAEKTAKDKDSSKDGPKRNPQSLRGRGRGRGRA